MKSFLYSDGAQVGIFGYDMYVCSTASCTSTLYHYVLFILYCNSSTKEVKRSFCWQQDASYGCPYLHAVYFDAFVCIAFLAEIAFPLSTPTVRTQIHGVDCPVLLKGREAWAIVLFAFSYVCPDFWSSLKTTIHAAVA